MVSSPVDVVDAARLCDDEDEEDFACDDSVFEVDGRESDEPGRGVVEVTPSIFMLSGVGVRLTDRNEVIVPPGFGCGRQLVSQSTTKIPKIIIYRKVERLVSLLNQR